MKKEVTYPGIVTKADGVYYIGFPNFEEFFCGTYGDTFEETVLMGKEYLFLKLDEVEGEFPKPLDHSEVKKMLKENQEVVYINFDFQYEKSLVELAYTKKTLTIPTYLDILAKNSKINFSQLLQKALKEELGI